MGIHRLLVDPGLLRDLVHREHVVRGSQRAQNAGHVILVVFLHLSTSGLDIGGLAQDAAGAAKPAESTQVTGRTSMLSQRLMHHVIRFVVGMVCVADLWLTVCWHWDCLDLHVLFLVACLAAIVWRPVVAVVLAALWISTFWSAVAGMRADPGPPVSLIRAGQDLATVYSALGRAEIELPEFGHAPQIARDMVGPLWFDASSPAVMWRYGGYRVWVTHRGGAVTAVSYRKYSDW